VIISIALHNYKEGDTLTAIRHNTKLLSKIKLQGLNGVLSEDPE